MTKGSPEIYEALREAMRLIEENEIPEDGRWIICTNRFLYETKVIGWWRYQYNRLIDFVWHLFHSSEDSTDGPVL